MQQMISTLEKDPQPWFMWTSAMFFADVGQALAFSLRIHRAISENV